MRGAERLTGVRIDLNDIGLKRAVVAGQIALVAGEGDVAAVRADLRPEARAHNRAAIGIRERDVLVRRPVINENVGHTLMSGIANARDQIGSGALVH